jgi:hypothetical protein
MTVPVYLNSSYYFYETAPITDVADLIIAFRDQVLNHNSPAWTEPSGGLFKSPADASSRWFDVLLTKIAANNLECRVRDSSGITIITGRMQIGSVAVVRIYTGQFHFHIESVAGTPEYVRGGIMDLTPESQSVHSQWPYAYTYRDTADAVRTNDWRQCAVIDNGSPTIAAHGMAFTCGSANKPMQTASGAWMFGACGLQAKPLGSPTNFRYAGRLYQQLLCPDDLPGSEFVVPIDAAAYGTFKVLGIGSAVNQRLACRMA